MYHTCGRFSSYVGKEVRRNIEVLMTLILVRARSQIVHVTHVCLSSWLMPS